LRRTSSSAWAQPRSVRAAAPPQPLRSYAIGDFALDGRSLRLKGINRIGNLLVPNDNYVSHCSVAAADVSL
jgi:hypothetical protein